MEVVVTGASGFIGSALIDALRHAGHGVRRLVRRTAASADERSWDPATGRLDPAALAGADAIVHLAGAGIADHRWSDAYKREIIESRVHSTTLLADALAGGAGPTVLLSGSAVGYYGDRGDEILDESASAGSGFLPSVCRAWEAATASASHAGVRVANLRTGIVLAAAGGALRKQLPLFKVGLGGRIGNGRQWQSWITLDDEVGAILHLLGAAVRGPVNLTAPNPVTNGSFAAALGHALHRPALVPVPRLGPSLLLGAEAASALLESQRVVPRVLEASGYEFRHPDLEGALRAVLTA